MLNPMSVSVYVSCRLYQRNRPRVAHKGFIIWVSDGRFLKTTRRREAQEPDVGEWRTGSSSLDSIDKELLYANRRLVHFSFSVSGQALGCDSVLLVLESHACPETEKEENRNAIFVMCFEADKGVPVPNLM